MKMHKVIVSKRDSKERPLVIQRNNKVFNILRPYYDDTEIAGYHRNLNYEDKEVFELLVESRKAKALINKGLDIEFNIVDNLKYEILRQKLDINKLLELGIKYLRNNSKFKEFIFEFEPYAPYGGTFKRKVNEPIMRKIEDERLKYNQVLLIGFIIHKWGNIWISPYEGC